MLKRTLWSIGFLALLSALPPARVEAAGISAGSPIVINPTTFVIPIQITDGVLVTCWSFGLSYDPSDWQINTETGSTAFPKLAARQTGSDLLSNP